MGLYRPVCTACSNPLGDALVYANSQMALSNDGCLALCDPLLYYTLLANGSRTSIPVPQREIISCKLCSLEHVVACNNRTCVNDYYK